MTLPTVDAEYRTGWQEARLSVIMAMIGNREHYQPMRSASAHNVLARFITDLWFQPDGAAARCARALPGGRQLPVESRFCEELRDADVVALPRTGMMQYLGARIGSGRNWRYRVYAAAGRQFARNCIRYLDVPHTAFLGYSSAALEALEHENRAGVMTVIDQIDPGRTEQEIVNAEMARHPSWVRHRLDIIPAEYFERLSAEWAEAKRIIVNSQWSKWALTQQGVPANKIRICPLGYQPATPVIERQYKRQRRLRVLWLGTLCLRKGIVYAIEAARLLERHPVDFTFAGPVDVRLPGLPANCTYAGKIARSEIGRLYAAHDIFILPTLSDGFAMTQLEAMAHGLPVIATANCGEAVEHGISGLVIPDRDAKALADAIMRIGTEEGTLEAMSAAALQRAELFQPERVWQAYQSHLT